MDINIVLFNTKPIITPFDTQSICGDNHVDLMEEGNSGCFYCGVNYLDIHPEFHRNFYNGVKYWLDYEGVGGEITERSVHRANSLADKLGVPHLVIP